jgi:hypothetical protein
MCCGALTALINIWARPAEIEGLNITCPFTIDHILSICFRYMELLFDCVVNFTVISQFEENGMFMLLVPV